MSELIRLPRQNIIAGVLPGLRSVPEVAGAYLFGSSLGDMRPDSDIDLGLVGHPGSNPFQLIGDVESACRPIGRHFVHATTLDDAGTIFAFGVISKGVLIYCVDAEIVTDLIERVALRYQEDGPAYYRALDEIYG